MFNKYHIHSLSFEFTPSIGTNIGTGGSIGNYALGQVTDPADEPLADFTSVRNLAHKTTSVLYIPSTLKMNMPNKTYFTGSGDSPTATTTIREQSPGQLVIAFKYNPTTFPAGVEFGYLTTKYDISLIDFFLPKNAPLPTPNLYTQIYGSLASLTSIRGTGNIPYSISTNNAKFKLLGGLTYILNFSVATAGDLSDIVTTLTVPDGDQEFLLAVNSSTPTVCNSDTIDKMNSSKNFYQFSRSFVALSDQTVTLSYTSSASFTSFAIQIVQINSTDISNRDFTSMPTTGPTTTSF